MRKYMAVFLTAILFAGLTATQASAAAPAAPVISRVDASAGVATLYWPQVSGAAGYNIYRNDQYVDTVGSGSVTQYRDVTSAGTHRYYITAFDSSRQQFSSKSNVVTADTRAGSPSAPPSDGPSDRGAPAAPVISRVQEYFGLAILQWSQVPGATGYNIYRNNTYLDTVGSGSLTQYRDDDADADMYQYYITAFDSTRQYSSKSNIVEADTRETLSSRQVDCRGISGVEAVLCGLLTERINDELEVGRISIDSNGLLFTYVNNDQIKINNSSCTARAYVTGQQASARISSSSRLRVEGDAITEPFAIRLTVPFELSARVNGKTKLGHRLLFGSCNKLGSDSYHATASARGTADVLTAFAINPTFSTDINGNLWVTIAPKAYVGTDLRDPHLDFDVSGVNPLAQFYAFTTGLTRTIGDGLVAGLSGDSVSDAVADRGLDLGVPIGLTAMNTISSTAVGELINGAAEHEAQRAARGLSADLEDDLNEQIADALDLNTYGRRTWVIDGDFARLLQDGATLDDLLK